jgi:tRNA (guanine-N7-)-methyltransferase
VSDTLGGADLRSFGRRRGRKLSARQQHLLDEVLPRVDIPLGEPQVNLADLFAEPVAEVWLEIGFGGGEHLVAQAEGNPSVGLIGCEVFEEGMVKVLSAIHAADLKNIRVCSEDARALLRHLPPASLNKVFILFPDPWPKKRHVKRRLVNRGLLQELARVLAPGAELRIATDIGDYLRTILASFRGNPDFAWQAKGAVDWREQGPDWPKTRYQAKALREGRRCYFLRFLRGG